MTLKSEPWVRKELHVQTPEDLKAHRGVLIGDSPFLSVRQLFLELKPSPAGQGRYFMVTFHKPVKVQKVRARIIDAFQKHDDLGE